MRRATLALAIGAATVAIVLIYAQAALPLAVWHLLVDGSVLVLWLLAAGGLGAAILRVGKFQVNSAHPALRLATAVALGLGAMSLLVLALGLCGFLNHVTSIAIIAVGFAAGLPAYRTLLHQSSQAMNQRVGWNALLLLIVPWLAIMTTGALIAPGLLWGVDDPAGYDVVEYHLQVPREWFQADRIIPLHHNVFSYFPFNVEMHYLLAMHLRGGPWAGMYLAQLMHAAMMSLTLIAIYGAARLTAGRVLACVATLGVATAPWIVMLGAVAYDEAGMLLFGTLSIAWTLFWINSQAKSLRTITLAGIFAGLACGSKLTAVPVILLSIPVALFVITILQRHMPPFRACAAFLLAGLLTFSPWLIRNQLWAHNPVFPEAMSIFGRGHFSEIQEQRWSQAHSPRPEERPAIGRLRAFGDQIAIDWRYAYALLPLSIIAAGLSLRTSSTRFLLALLLLLLIFWLAVTHLQSRFFVLAIPLAALLLAQVRHPKWPAIAGLLLAVGAIPAYVSLHTRLLPFTRGIGLEGIESHDTPLVLVGDAKAFWYQASPLYYRTVFDVDNSIELGIVQDWIGPVPITRNTIVEVDPSELMRFARTYYGIPQPPADIRNHDHPFTLDLPRR